MDHRDRIILQKVLSEIEIAQDMLCSCTFTAFEQNEMLKRAICMTVINTGKLIKNLSEQCRSEYRSIPWKEIAGFRDIAAKYQILRLEDVYETVISDFHALGLQLRSVLE